MAYQLINPDFHVCSMLHRMSDILTQYQYLSQTKLYTSVCTERMLIIHSCHYRVCGLNCINSSIYIYILSLLHISNIMCIFLLHMASKQLGVFSYILFYAVNNHLICKTYCFGTTQQLVCINCPITSVHTIGEGIYNCHLPWHEFAGSNFPKPFSQTAILCLPGAM